MDKEHLLGLEIRLDIVREELEIGEKTRDVVESTSILFRNSLCWLYVYVCNWINLVVTNDLLSNKTDYHWQS